MSTEKQKQTEFSFPKDVRFIHDRPTTYYGEYLPKGGTTFAYYIDHNEHKIYYSIAFCNDEDLYCRKTGRDLAMARLTNLIENQVAVDKNGNVVADTICINALKELLVKEIIFKSQKIASYECIGVFREEHVQKIADSIAIKIDESLINSMTISIPAIIHAIKMHAYKEAPELNLS